MAVEYPEHEKMALVKDKAHAIGEFLDFVRYDKKVALCKFEHYDYVEGEYIVVPEVASHDKCTTQCEFRPLGIPIENLLAMYFGIDLDVIEKEKRAMLESIRTTSRGLPAVPKR